MNRCSTARKIFLRVVLSCCDHLSCQGIKGLKIKGRFDATIEEMSAHEVELTYELSLSLQQIVHLIFVPSRYNKYTVCEGIRNARSTV